MGNDVVRWWRFGILKSDLSHLQNARMRDWVIKSYTVSRSDRHGEWVAIFGTVFMWLSKPKAAE